LIGISSIHLLKTFINASGTDAKTLLWQTIIHGAFLISALALAWIDRMTFHAPMSAQRERVAAEL
jgi:uncharacterized protein (TIGR00645 family)